MILHLAEPQCRLLAGGVTAAPGRARNVPTPTGRRGRQRQRSGSVGASACIPAANGVRDGGAAIDSQYHEPP
jgi:hypothetical protein